MNDLEAALNAAAAAKRVLDKPACQEWDDLRRLLNVLADQCGEWYRPAPVLQFTPGYARKPQNREEEPVKRSARSRKNRVKNS